MRWHPHRTAEIWNNFFKENQLCADIREKLQHSAKLHRMIWFRQLLIYLFSHERKKPNLPAYPFTVHGNRPAQKITHKFTKRHSKSISRFFEKVFSRPRVPDDWTWPSAPHYYFFLAITFTYCLQYVRRGATPEGIPAGLRARTD